MNDDNYRGPRRGQPTVSEVTCGGITLRGASVSAYKTFVFCRELGVIFDLGDLSEEMLPLDTVFISHGHQDHLLAVTRYAGLRRLQHMHPPTIVVPEALSEPVQRLFQVWSELESRNNRRPPPFTLVAARRGEEIPIPGRRIAKAFDVPHAGASLGYTLFERKQKLLPEYQGYDGRQIAALKNRGETVAVPYDRPLVRYVGDTTESGLRVLEGLEECPVTVIECTFLRPEHESLAAPRGHLHIQHILRNIELFGNTELVLTHFSRRYGRTEAYELLNAAVPAGVRERVHLLL